MRPKIEHKGVCGNCHEKKKLEDFPKHKQGSSGRRNTCKKCHSHVQYQRYLWRLGERHVAECEKCGSLMKRKNTGQICRGCKNAAKEL